MSEEKQYLSKGEKTPAPGEVLEWARKAKADLVDLIPQFAVTADAQRRLLVDNPARLYGFA